MIQGTTPTHTFTLPMDTSLLSVVRVIYSQNGNPILTRCDAILEGNTATLKLTQEETLRFDPTNFVFIQVRILTKSGDSLASDVIKVAVKPLLENEVLEHDDV